MTRSHNELEKVRTNHKQEAKPTIYLVITFRENPTAIVVDAKMCLSRFSDVHA